MTFKTSGQHYPVPKKMKNITASVCCRVIIVACEIPLNKKDL